MELKIERIGQRVVEVQCLQEFGCQTGMPGSTWCANDHVVLHIYGPKWFHRTWDESNRSSDCGVEASAIIWVLVVMPGRTQQANDHVTEHLFFIPPYFSLERQGTTNRHARWLWLCHSVYIDLSCHPGEQSCQSAVAKAVSQSELLSPTDGQSYGKPQLTMAFALAWSWWVNTLRPRQNGRHFADDILKGLFLNENAWIPIEISLKFVPKGPIDNIPALV